MAEGHGAIGAPVRAIFAPHSVTRRDNSSVAKFRLKVAAANPLGPPRRIVDFTVRNLTKGGHRDEDGRPARDGVLHVHDGI